MTSTGTAGWWRRGASSLNFSGVFRLAPADATAVPALLACTCVGVPLLLLAAVDRLDVAAYAAFGAFTGLYGRNEPYRERARTLGMAAVTMVLSVMAGAAVGALTTSTVVHVLVVSLMAGTSKLLLDALRAGPPGAIMPVFGTAVSASAVTQPAQVGPAVGLCAAAAAWSWMVCMSPRLLRPHGPQRVAVARALEAVARRVESVGTAEQDRQRHGAAFALQRAWHALGSAPSGRSAGTLNDQLFTLVVHAETVLRRTRLSQAAGQVPSAEWARECRRLAAATRRGAVPQVGRDVDEEAEVAGRRAMVRLETDLGLGSSGGPLHRTAQSSRLAGLSSMRLGSAETRLAGRIAMASAVAGLLSPAFGLGHFYWASVSAVAVLSSINLASASNRAAHRAVGTVAGVLVGVAAIALTPGPAAALVAVVICQGLAELTVTRNYALCMVFSTPIALLLSSLAHPVPPVVLARDRVFDTLLGAVVAVALYLMLPGRGALAALDSALLRVEQAVAGPAPTGGDGDGDGNGQAAHVARALFALHAAYEVAAGEPWSQDLPTERVMAAERDGNQLLAELTA